MRAAVLFLMWWFAVVAHAQSLEIIQLHNRPADQVLPVVRPLLEAGASASGSGFQLFIRASPGNLAQIRQVVASLDRPARQLVIYVRQDAQGTSNRLAAAAGAQLAPGDSRVRAGIDDRTVGTGDNAAQQVRAQEGVPAYISAGSSTPVVASSVTRTVNGVVVQQTVTPREISSGFYVTPRVNGDNVFLDISTQRQTPGNSGPGSADTNRMSSTISGKLGAWIELGGVSQAQSSSVRGIGSSISSSDASSRSVYVKVEEAR